MLGKNLSCCFSGHRPNKLPWRFNEEDPRCLCLKQRIYDAAEAVYRSGIRHYICGMAAGCDMYFCDAVIALREQFGGITLEAAIPWEGQADRWPPELRQRYDRLVSECDYCTLVQHEYSDDCTIRRNHYMVDSSSILIAAYNRNPHSGTGSTISYATRRGVEIIEIFI